MPIRNNGVSPMYTPYTAQAVQQQYQNQWASSQQMTPSIDYYVHGIEGANAFQMPMGVNKVRLWDEDLDQFFVKGYDQNGIPRILGWFDYSQHVVEEPKTEQNASSTIDLSKYLTKEDFEKAIAQLCVGERGRIVMNHEPDA